MKRLAMAVGLCGGLLLGCSGAKDARYPTMEIRYFELSEGQSKERSKNQEQLNATLIHGAQLQHKKAVDLLRAAETPEGGSPARLMKAGRTLVAGDGVVLLGTVRHEASGGSATAKSVLSVALSCSAASFDEPGDLKDCNGYLMRVPKTWPAEVYDITGATVSIRPEGGVARGRIHGKSNPGTFSVELDGEFAASLAEYTVAPSSAPVTQ